MKKVLEINASTKKEAFLFGKDKVEKLLGKSIDNSKISVSLLKEKKVFFGFGKKKNIYQLVYDDTLSESDEKFLETATEAINIDGGFKIKIIDSGIYLKVTPSRGNGKPVSIINVKATIEEKDIVDVDWQNVEEIINKVEAKWLEIAPRKPELDRDADVIIELSKDKLKASLTYTPALGGKKISKDDIKEIIIERGINFGIIDNTLGEIIERREKMESVLIAEGEAPTPGKDATLDFKFKKDAASIGTKRDDGSMDFYNLGLITNVAEGDVLVVKVPSETGIPGKTVTGEEISPAKPKEINLPRGKNTEIVNDNLVASIAGQVVLDQRNKVQVLPIYEVKGDVDLSTGNIEFVGNVIIRGNVTEGFKITADGNVEIKGNVSVADIKAGGDVLIHHGFVGKNKSKIISKGDVRVKFVENGYIKSEKNIFIGDAAMHSKLFAGDSIEVINKKGLLVGGITRARNKIEANIFGSNLATITKLEAGMDPELKVKIKNLEEEITSIKTNLVKVTKATRILEQLKESSGGLPQEKLVMYSQLGEAKSQLEGTVEEKKQMINKIHSKLDMSDKGFIQSRKKIYPGVRVTIGNAQLNIHNEMTGSKFVEQDGEVTQLSIGW